MTNLFVQIKNKELRLFNWQEFYPFSADFTTIYVDYRADGRTMFYNHVLPDDAYHSLLMCKMTADYICAS